MRVKDVYRTKENAIRTHLVISLLIIGVLSQLSCSDGSGGSGLVGIVGPPGATTTQGATTTLIQTSVQGAHVASQIAQSRELIFNSTQMQKNLGDIVLPLMSPALIGQNTDIVCTDGGSFQYAGTYVDESYELTLIFSGCREKGYQYVGSYTVSGIPSDFSITLGGSSTFNIFVFDPSYTVLLAYLKASLLFNMVGSGNSTDASFTITSNGRIESFDYFLLDTFAMRFINLKSAYALSTNSVTNDQTISITSDGQFRESWGGNAYTFGMKLTSFIIDKVALFDVNSGSFYADETGVNGSIVFYFQPSTFGFSGTFTVAAETPIRTVYALPKQTTLGTIVINDNATVQYNTGGDLNVTVTGDALLQYTNEYNLMKLSDFAAMEKDKPPLIPPPGAGTPISLTTGSTMAVTLTWTGPAPSYTSTSDMDLHVKYYSVPNPTASDVETWHVDWHQGKSYPGFTASCSDPAGLRFSDAFDLDPDHSGICDIGLDFDDINGYGPEHITALKIPAGYYVVSVNSFSLNPAEYPTTLYLSLHIGDSIVGPYIGTLSNSDGEGTTPTAWMRVADVRVNADGSIDVLTPDVLLVPWGDGAH